MPVKKILKISEYLAKIWTKIFGLLPPSPTPYGSCRPSAVADFQLRRPMPTCVDDIAAWMLANRLQLTTGKTDLLWCATSRRRHQLPTSALRIGSDLIKPSASIKDLGIYSACDATFRQESCAIAKMTARCALYRS